MTIFRRTIAAIRGPLVGVSPAGRPGLQACLWLLLVGIAVVGRLWRPEWNGAPLWNVTPLSGAAVVAGAVFANRLLLAASVPLVALALSNLAEPGYGSVAVAVVVFAATAWPVLLGGVARRGWLGMLCGGLAASLGFFLITNAAHWLFTTDYPHTGAGLVACYVAALPFYRPLGDLVWTGVLAAVTAAALRAADWVPTAVLGPAACPSPTAVRRQSTARPADARLD